MRLAELTALIALSAAVSPALAADGGGSAASPQQRAVLICDADATTRTAFARQYGQPPVFITAREAMAARSSGEAWTAPRCMTAREHERYVRLSNAVAAR